MPSPTLILDRIEDAQVQQDQSGTRIIRTGIILDINTAAAPEQILINTLGVSGVPAYLSAFPGTTDCLLRRRLVEPIRGMNNKVKIVLYYDTGGPATPPPSTFILTRSTTLVERSTELTPIGRVPIVVTSTPNPSFPNIKITPHVASVRYLAPFQRLIATGYFIGTPPAAMIDALGTVNSTSWHGYAKGYWLYAAQHDTSQDLGLSYNITLEFWNQMQFDWSSWSVFRDPHGMILAPKASDTDDLQNRPYITGITSLDRVVKVGLYGVTNFNSVFGF